MGIYPFVLMEPESGPETQVMGSLETEAGSSFGLGQ